MRNRFIFEFAVRLALFAFFAVGLLWRCGSAAMPQGGPKDSLPPVVVSMSPAYGVTNFDGKTITIEFDEYIQIKDQQKEFYVSPRINKKPTLLNRGKSVQIEIQDTLKENTTYALNFGSSIADNNEGNPLNSFRYVFSTGDYIDSMLMSGYAVDAYKKDSVSKAFVFFYEAEKAHEGLDSTVFNEVPDIIARTEDNGIFLAENLKPVDYRVYVLQDNNGNQTYEPGVDGIAFLDSVFNPTDMPAFNVWYDTTRSYVNADPQLYFRVFRDEPFRRQYLKGNERPMQHKIVLTFGAPYPEVDTLMFEGIPSSRIITEHLRPTLDSVALWINLPSEYIPDTIRGRISYMRHDSINQLERFGQNLTLTWKAFESKEQQKEREAREKERQKAIDDGEEPPKEPSTFKYSMDPNGGNLNPEKHIGLTFDYPLVKLDTAQISLIRTEEENQYRVRYTLEEDSTNIRRYILKAPWATDQKYELEIPEGAFMNVAQELNDTIRASFTVLDPEKFATLVFNLKGKEPDSEYILELLDQTGGRIVHRVPNATTGTYTFRFLDPGGYRLRIVEDMNGNGEWDTGDLIERRQPERVEMYLQPTGEEEINTRMGWEAVFDVDCNIVFAPVTMRSVMEQIRKMEEVRIRKLIEDREKRMLEENKNKNQGTNAGMGGGSFNPTGGFNIR